MTAAATAATASWRRAVPRTLRPDMAPIAAPSASAAIAPMITEAITAPVPSVKNQGNRGKMAPIENDRNDVTAARQAEPGACGSTPSSSRAWVSRAIWSVTRHPRRAPRRGLSRLARRGGGSPPDLPPVSQRPTAAARRAGGVFLAVLICEPPAVRSTGLS